MNKIVKAELLSANNTKLKIELQDGNFIEGYSKGIEPAFDDDGEELDFDVLVIQTDNQKATIRLKNEEIVKVEKAS